MKISSDFIGGNIIVEKQDGDTVYLLPDLRDSTENWFYWAFCVSGAKGETVTFDFCDKNVIGYYGPAVSSDFKNWEWLGKTDERSRFAYTFAGNEPIYFAHNMPYLPEKFFRFCDENNLKPETLCISEKGREVPCLKFGSGEKNIILTSRHHACESTGTYVLQGVLTELINEMPRDISVLCVPFVDYDGVVDGDQGKARAPHDHNRDYLPEPIYATTRAIKDFADKNGVFMAFDFHSPWHMYGRNDAVFIVHNDFNDREEVQAFSELFKKYSDADTLGYDGKDDIESGQEWNSMGDKPNFAAQMAKRGKMAFTLETAYFGREDYIFCEEKAIHTGVAFAKALKEYLKTR